MSVTELKNRPGWYDVVVYDRVKTRGQKPEKVSKRIKGQRVAEKVERDLLKLRDEGLLVVHAESVNGYAMRWLETRRSEVSRATHASYRRVLTRYVARFCRRAHQSGDDPRRASRVVDGAQACDR